ncbi:MAG: ectoine hydroxylase [Gammaproteobacteria bacterium]|jgi:ectoine hydroxylase
MKPEEILANPARVLSRQQREDYFESGYLLLPEFLKRDWLDRIREVSALFVEQSRARTKSDSMFDIEPTHSAEAPKLRRLSFPVDHHEVFRELAFNSPIVDVAQDLLGPNVCYHHSKLNFKWSGGGEEIKWHQDIQYWPHTDFSPLTIGIYIEGVDDEMGPMGIVPGSHRGPLYNLQDKDGRWVGAIQQADLLEADPASADYLKGPAGSVTVHNCCSVHGSAPNVSSRIRPLLLQTYAAGDSFPLQTVGTNGLGQYANTMVRGSRPEVMNIDGRNVPVAPDYSGGYISIMDVQHQGTK